MIGSAKGQQGAPLAGFACQLGCLEIENDDDEGAQQLHLVDVLPQAGDYLHS